jgi:hypothetical protein
MRIEVIAMETDFVVLPTFQPEFSMHDGVGVIMNVDTENFIKPSDVALV